MVVDCMNKLDFNSSQIERPIRTNMVKAMHINTKKFVSHLLALSTVLVNMYSTGFRLPNG